MSNEAKREREDLRRAVEQLYATFQAYPLRPDSIPCTPGCTPGGEPALCAVPLRELTVNQLRDYAERAVTTWGEAVDFKHFLPRVFEIVATGDLGGWPSLEVVYATLRHAAWRTWPTEEQRAVETYFVAKWHVTIGEFPSVHGAEDVLCAIAQSVSDMSPFLNAWYGAEGDAPARHLAGLLSRTGGTLSNPFWSREQRAQQEQIRAWLRRRDVHEWLERAFFATRSSDVAAELSAAVTIIETVR